MAPPTTIRQGTTGLKRKAPISSRRPNINVTLAKDLPIDDIRKQLKRKLRLNFLPDIWQAHLIQRILQGYDSILCAGTGYGKSLIFEGLAKLAGNGKVVVVISPLKALERDQALQASKKGIHTVVLNEDTTKSHGLWERAKTKAAIIYCSPEMALAPRFLHLWTDVGFRNRLTAVIVDEAHCIEDWGGDDFRPQYMELESLRTFTGQEVPFLACTATCMTSTFDLLWKTLQFGHRPFWGLDVGVDRPNLFFQVQGIENTNYPLLDILNIFPSELSETTKREEIPKAILYFDTEAKCREAVQFLRKILPQHLRNAVHAFSSTLSEDGKATNWDDFLANLTRLLCATDAAGMGCNVTDIEFVISIGIPKSVGQSYQRWGRAGRDRVKDAVCVQLVPPWAIQAEATLNPTLARVAGKAKPIGSKKDAARRAKLPSQVNKFLNLKHERKRRDRCYHQYSKTLFRPDTKLDLYHALGDDARPIKFGERSRSAPYELMWTVLDAGNSPDYDQCCSLCNPDHEAVVLPCDVDDPRLCKFADEFVYPITQPQPHARPSSSASNHSDSSNVTSGTTSSLPRTNKPLIELDQPQFSESSAELDVTGDSKEQLEAALVRWRESQHDKNEVMISSTLLLPPKQIKLIVNAAKAIAATTNLTTAAIRKLSPLPHLSAVQLDSLLSSIIAWRDTLLPVPPPESRPTPRAERRSAKRTRNNTTPRGASPTPGAINTAASLMLHSDNDCEMGNGSTDDEVPHVAPPPQPTFSPIQGHYRPDNYAPSPGRKSYYRAQTRLQSDVTPSRPSAASRAPTRRAPAVTTPSRRRAPTVAVPLRPPATTTPAPRPATANPVPLQRFTPASMLVPPYPTPIASSPWYTAHPGYWPLYSSHWPPLPTASTSCPAPPPFVPYQPPQ